MRRRGRPRQVGDADLCRLACELLGENALRALGTGVSKSELARHLDVDRATITRCLDSNHMSATPLLLAAGALFSLNSSGVRETIVGLVSLFDSLMSIGFEAEQVFRQVLLANLQATLELPSLPTAFLLQSAALSSLGSSVHLDNTEAAKVLNLRKHFYDEMTKRYSAAVAFVLTRLGRRPRAGVSVRDITVALHAFQDGITLRLRLDPASLSHNVAVDSMWAVLDALTEHNSFVGLEAAEINVRSASEDLLTTVRHAPAEEDQAIGTEREPGHAEAMWGQVLGSISDLRVLASLDGAAMAAVREALRCIAEESDRHRWLVDAVPRSSSLYMEVESFLSFALQVASDVVCAYPDRAAELLLSQALLGKAGARAWIQTLSLLTGSEAGEEIVS